MPMEAAEIEAAKGGSASRLSISCDIIRRQDAGPVINSLNSPSNVETS
jgi:hypothetical protein